MSEGKQTARGPIRSLLARGPVRRFLLRAVGNWRERHRRPFNYLIHIPGILLAVAGVFLLFFLPWYWGVTAIVIGYFLQWLGHLAEGNDVGEWAAIKRMLGLPYVGIAPRKAEEKQAAAAPIAGTGQDPAPNTSIGV
ncbi:MAG TPA: Mpo1-like protein [Gemmataceae bacterium]|jgi:hypothetical protein|nr:Mpo1-like protein [Gemmataceae bacterium]